MGDLPHCLVPYSKTSITLLWYSYDKTSRRSMTLRFEACTIEERHCLLSSFSKMEFLVRNCCKLLTNASLGITFFLTCVTHSWTNVLLLWQIGAPDSRPSAICIELARSRASHRQPSRGKPCLGSCKLILNQTRFGNKRCLCYLHC